MSDTCSRKCNAAHLAEVLEQLGHMLRECLVVERAEIDRGQITVAGKE